ncbi:uncharacterized protein LOC131657910 [Vicia villosa]|uniref:uncharacterized protein LOC131657910 n=1 Tax=Vicia villosa TaxID=3911 RepID=UPI00273B6332|nr:uncharacterized protein LOC131657910 [Vicia villosa]
MIEMLWQNRNNFIWNNEKEEALRLGWIASHRWQEWLLAQHHQDREVIPPNSQQWTPPPVGWLKCNVDAGFNRNKGTSNRGWCIRDNMGHFVKTGVAWDVGTLSVLEVEALALKEAIQGTVDLHLDHVVFASDSQQVVQAIHSNVTGSSEFNFIIQSIKLLLLDFPNFEVEFVKRQANMVAHCLTKAANS